MGESAEALQHTRDRRSARFRLLFVLTLVALGILTLLVGALSYGSSTTDRLEFQVFTLQETYPEVLLRAQEWRRDARLQDANFDFRPKDTEGRGWASFGFRSLASPQEWLNVYVIKMGDEVILEQEAGTFRESNRPVGDPVTPSRLALDTVEVLDISLENGGREFIQSRGEAMLWPQTAFLHYLEDVSMTGPIVWRVSYSIPIIGPNLTVLINAETGELLETEYREARSPGG